MSSERARPACSAVPTDRHTETSTSVARFAEPTALPGELLLTAGGIMMPAGTTAVQQLYAAVSWPLNGELEPA